MLVFLTGNLSGQLHTLTLKHPRLGTDSHVKWSLETMKNTVLEDSI